MKSKQNKMKILNVFNFVREMKKHGLVISRVLPLGESYFVETARE